MLVAGETRQAYQETSMAATKFGSNREMKTSGESRDYPAAPIARHSAAGILDFSTGNIFKSTFIWYHCCPVKIFEYGLNIPITHDIVT